MARVRLNPVLEAIRGKVGDLVFKEYNHKDIVTTIQRPGFTNSVSLRQSDNAAQPSNQTVESEHSFECLLPQGTGLSLTDRGTGGGSALVPSSSRSPGSSLLEKLIPVRFTMRDRIDTTLGAAHRDTTREWASKASQMQPVMWTGIAMMTIVAALLGYVGWWTKAALAVVVGAGIIVLAQALPDHGTTILLAGLGMFGLIALLVLYAYHKGQLDKDQNGIPDFLERDRVVPF
jgi:hypothetical protein